MTAPIYEVIGTFGRADVLQRLKNQSLYHEILLKKTEEGRFKKNQPQTGSFLSTYFDCV